MPSRFPEPSRRALLGGGLASAVAMVAPPVAAQSLRAAFDGLGTLPDYEHRLAALARLSANGESAAIDLDTIRQGLRADALLETLRPSARKLPWALPLPADAPAIWQLPHGAALYALLLDRQLGESITPAAAYRLLQAEVTQLAARADRCFRSLGMIRGSTGERYRALWQDPDSLYSDDDAGRDQAVAEMNATLAAIRPQLAAHFGPLPDVRVERMPRAEEAAGKQGYRRLPGPGVPGAYVVDLREILRRPRWSLTAVVHHELLPGHMIQLPIEASVEPHPLRLAYLPAFAEGWAIHAEQWALDRVRNGDVRTELGQLHWLLFRALRGLIDTGIHHRRWSRSKALQTLEHVQGEPAYFASFVTDIDRMIRDPGVRAAEALIWLRLRQLRRRAGGTTGDQRFHAIVLDHGRQRIDRIARQF
jgi:uncharacterized protein (DUF885 family)